MGILARIVEEVTELIREVLGDKNERSSSSPGMTVSVRLANAEANERAKRRLAKAKKIIERCDKEARDSQSAKQPPWGRAANE